MRIPIFMTGVEIIMGAFQSMRTKFIMMMVGASLVTMVCVAGIFLKNMADQMEEEVANVKKTLVEDVERELKIETETAISLINQIYKRQQAGLLTEAEAKKEAADLVRDLRYDDGAGYFWVDTYEGVNVVLLGRNTEGKSRIGLTDPTGKQFIKEMIENGRKDGGGYTDLMFAKPNETEPLPKRNYTAAFAPYQWVLGTGVWIDYIDARVAKVQEAADAAFYSSVINVAIVIVVLEALLIAVAVYLGNHMVAPILRLTERLGIIATGDFRDTSASEDSSRGDEIGAMGRAMDKMKLNINSLMKTVVSSSEQVAAASEQLTASADQSAKAIHQVADSIVRVAGACNEQFVEVEHATEQTEQLSTNMTGFTETLGEALQKIETTNAAADEGAKNVMNAVSQMKLIESSVSESAKVIAELGEESDKIGKIVDAISAIAEQTNLLALNAAIEAARAGEHGRGFAVVADEVRKLAEQSQTSAGEISSLITSIQEKAQNAVHVMQSGVDQTKAGTEAVDGAGDTFRQIAQMVTEVAERSNRMKHIVENLSEGSDVISQAVGRIDGKSRDVARESETVSAASEEQTATMHEIADASRSLAQMAQEMQNSLSQFKI